MSARKTVENLLWWSVPSSDDDQAKRTAERMLDAMLAEHAHKLAEKIRRMRDACRYDPDSTEYRHMSSSADLIDSEAKS